MVDEGGRPLHAKWIQVSVGDRDLVLTGSVNATSKSLGGTDNIEVSVLRERRGAESTRIWHTAPTPAKIQSQSFRAAGIGDACLVHARIESGCIRGQVLARTVTPGLWAGQLRRPNGDTAEIDAQVEANGNFTSAEPVPEQFWNSTSVQVELVGPDCTARGWLQNDDILRAQGTRAVDVSLLVRMINREETEEDEVALLDFLARSLADLPLPSEVEQAHDPTPASAKHRRDQSEDEEDRRIPLSLLRPFEQTVGSDGEIQLTSPSQDPLQRLFAHLRRRILGRSSYQHGAESPAPRFASGNDEDDPNAEAAEGTATIVRERVRQSIDDFDVHLRELVEEGQPEYRRSLLVLWLEVSLHMRLSRLGEPWRAMLFLRSWVLLATEVARAEQPWRALEDHVSMSVALLAWGAAEDPRGGLESEVYLHERLERFFAKIRFVEDACVSVESGTGAALADLFGADIAARREAFDRVVATRTRRQELIERLQDYLQHRPPVDSSPVFEGPVGARLRKALSRWDRVRVRSIKADRSGCPFCALDLRADRATLHRERILACTWCDGLIVDLTP